MAASQNALCYDAALRILAVRAHSARQLRQKLARRSFESDVVEETLHRLQRDGWLDERAFAADVVRSRVRKLHGPRRIERELQAAGLSAEAARSAVREELGNEAADRQLREACEKKLRAMRRRFDDDYLLSDQGRNKLASYLLQQGYEASGVIDAVDEALSRVRSLLSAPSE